MKRRNFIRKSLAGGSLFAVSPFAMSSGVAHPDYSKDFRLKYAPHFGMFEHHAGKDLGDQLRFMADQGFRALEDNGMADRSVAEQEKLAKLMQQLGIEMGVFVVNMATAWKVSLSNGQPDGREKFLDECRKAVEVAKRVNARWMTVVPGLLHHRLEMDYQTAHVVESLKQAAAIFEPHGLVMVLEPLNHFRDHPELFLSKIPQAYLICKAVNSPSCKILFDMYHQQISEGNIIQNIDLAYDEVAYFQIGDNPGRKEPGTGEMNYRNIFRHIYKKGFKGIMGMEHGNAYPGKEGEAALIAAYREADSFKI
jgi:hydroxypyruvate isomerase